MKCGICGSETPCGPHEAMLKSMELARDRAMDERDRLTAQLMLKDAEIATLRAALANFAPGSHDGVWGRIKAFIVNGAPTREEGIALARQITEWQVKIDYAWLLKQEEWAARDCGGTGFIAIPASSPGPPEGEVCAGCPQCEPADREAPCTCAQESAPAFCRRHGEPLYRDPTRADREDTTL